MTTAVLEQSGLRLLCQKRQFAWEAHTACDRKGFILGVHGTAGNVHGNIAWDPLYDAVTKQFPETICNDGRSV